ncbi:MAG: pantoate--beta-alanine ligase [Phototrophicaceae bacterium]
MHIIDTIADLRTHQSQLTGTVGLVPTMGYLHQGHLSLIKAAKETCDTVVATIFVNPTQFSANEDLDLYPRDMPRDLALLNDAGVDLVFTPTPTLMYPPRFQTWVTVEEVTQEREGAKRPEHFRGVTTVVAKLFNLVQPDIAFFGQKDAQQVVVIRQMVRDLNMPLSIQVCPIVREPDGLALSSRNVYLQPNERQAARVLNIALQQVGQAYENGERHPDTLRKIVQDTVNREPLAQLDYVSVADAATLTEITDASDNPLLVSLAAQVGKPRLLDNCLLPLHLNTRDYATQTLGFVNT